MSNNGKNTFTMCEFSQILPLQQVVSLEEDFTKTGRSGWIISVVEPVESVEFLKQAILTDQWNQRIVN